MHGYEVGAVGVDFGYLDNSNPFLCKGSLHEKGQVPPKLEGNGYSARVVYTRGTGGVARLRPKITW